MSITVIMPMKNAERTVELAVRSTLCGLKGEDRLLVFDDGSTDGSAEILRSLRASDSRVSLYSDSSISGVADALNSMLGEVDTRFVARMDADDVSLPWRFGYQRAEIEAGVDVVFTSRVNFGSRARSFLPAPLVRLGAPGVATALLFGNPVPHSSMVARTEVLRRAGGYRQSVAEDYDLWLRLAASGHSLQSLVIPGIAYRMHAGQVTRRGSWAEEFRADKFLKESYGGHAISLGWSGLDAWDLQSSASSTPGARTGYVEFLKAKLGMLSRVDRSFLRWALGGRRGAFDAI